MPPKKDDSVKKALADLGLALSPYSDDDEELMSTVPLESDDQKESSMSFQEAQRMVYSPETQRTHDMCYWDTPLYQSNHFADPNLQPYNVSCTHQYAPHTPQPPIIQFNQQSYMQLEPVQLPPAQPQQNASGQTKRKRVARRKSPERAPTIEPKHRKMQRFANVLFCDACDSQTTFDGETLRIIVCEDCLKKCGTNLL